MHTPPTAASDQDLYCLPMSVLSDTRHNFVGLYERNYAVPRIVFVALSLFGSLSKHTLFMRKIHVQLCLYFIGF